MSPNRGLECILTQCITTFESSRPDIGSAWSDGWEQAPHLKNVPLDAKRRRRTMERTTSYSWTPTRTTTSTTTRGWSTWSRSAAWSATTTPCGTAPWSRPPTRRSASMCGTTGTSCWSSTRPSPWTPGSRSACFLSATASPSAAGSADYTGITRWWKMRNYPRYYSFLFFFFFPSPVFYVVEPLSSYLYSNEWLRIEKKLLIWLTMELHLNCSKKNYFCKFIAGRNWQTWDH